jgi:hypothetical protein
VHVLTGEGNELDPGAQLDTSGLLLPNPGVVNLDVVLNDPVPDRDAWYVVIAMGIGGRDLSPVYKEHPYKSLEIADILSTSFASIAAAFDFGGVLIPRVFRVYPYAVTNPVFVDVDGDADGDGRLYEAPHPTPSWASGGDLSRLSMPLSSKEGPGPLRTPTDPQTLRDRRIIYFLGRLYQAMLHQGSR